MAEQPEKKATFTDECESIEQCPSLQRIVQYLQIHQTVDPQDICQELNQQSTPFLTDDFNHILLYHLSDDKPVDQTRNEYERIYNYITTKIPQCQLSKCSKYERNNRERETQNILKGKTDATTTYYVETMDRMHCFFIHSFDVGFRVKSKELKDIFTADDNKSDQDLSMIKLTKLLNSRRQALENARGSKALQNTKFVTEIGIGRDSEEKTEDEEEIANEYSMGMRYYYEGYKGWDNSTLVKKKYASFKDEITNNTECTISIDEFNMTMERAARLLNTKVGKKIVSDKWKWLCDYYDIEENSAITAAHILSVLFYTDYSDLSYHFSSTFRKKDASQTTEMCVRRNAEYAIWSKLLSQTVNIFGQPIEQTKIETFFHGISSLLIFSTFLSFYNAPTSTTIQPQVAAIFSGETGAILQLKNGGYYLKCFNCSWLSAFANEDERLFMMPFTEDGYDRKLRITSITSRARNENYRYYVHAITSFSYAINGQDISKFAHDFTKRDFIILSHLIKQTQQREMEDIAMYQSAVYGNKQLLLQKRPKANESGSKFPKYVMKVFHEFAKNVQKVKVNVNYLHALQSIFVSPNGFFNIVTVLEIFANCEKMEIWYNYDNDQHLKSDYFAHIASELNAAQNKKLTNVDFNRVKYDRKLLEQYKAELVKWNPEAVHDSKCTFSKTS